MSLWRYGWWLDGHQASSLVVASSGAVLDAGKYYWEVTATFAGQTAASIMMGVADSRTVLVETCDAALNLAIVQATGANFINSGVAAGAVGTVGWGYPARPGGGGLVAQASGDVFGFCLDTLNKKVWAKNVTQNSPTDLWDMDPAGAHGDPAINTFGADISATGPSPMVGNIYVIMGASLGNSGMAGSGTVNFGGSVFTGTPPTGFHGIETSFSGAALNPSDNSNIVLSNLNKSFAGTNVTQNGLTNHNSVRSVFSIAQGP